MTRLVLASIAVVGTLSVAPWDVEAQKETPKKGVLPQSNRVYVKIILPADPATRDKDGPVVESWIAEQLKKRGLAKFVAATAWVPLTNKRESTRVEWYGNQDEKGWACPVTANIVERADGRIKVHLQGWGPGGDEVTISLADEPGSREIAAVEELTWAKGLPYVAVLIGPPPEKQAAPTK